MSREKGTLLRTEAFNAAFVSLGEIGAGNECNRAQPPHNRRPQPRHTRHCHHYTFTSAVQLVDRKPSRPLQHAGNIQPRAARAQPLRKFASQNL